MKFSLSSITGTRDFELSHRVLNFVLFSFFVFAGCAEIANLIVSESLIVHIAATFFMIYAGVAYYISRLKGKNKIIAHLTVIFSFAGITVFYIYDGGLYCGNGFYIIVDVALIITVLKGRKRYFYLFFLIMLIVFLVGMETYFPGFVVKISKKQCFLNTILGFLIALISLIFLLLFFVVQLEEQNLNIEKMSKTDYLTGLLNRRGIWEKLDWFIKDSIKKGYPFSIILADIDDFKLINDKYGHLSGDKALIEIASRMLEAIREGDIVGRWGGEEFIIILPNADFENALMVANRIKSKVVEQPIVFDNVKFNITLTMGVGVYHRELSPDKNLSRIDLAMYKGKKEGKNRIIPAG